MELSLGFYNYAKCDFKCEQCTNWKECIDYTTHKVISNF